MLHFGEQVDGMDFELNLKVDTVEQAHPAVPVCVEPGASAHAVFRLMKEHATGAVLINRDGRLAGIFTERDALRLMAEGANLDVPIESVMKTDPVTVKAGDSVGKAIAKMSFGGYRRLPIVNDQGAAVGLLKVSGILHYLVEHFPEVVYTLPPKPHHMHKEREGA